MSNTMYTPKETSRKGTYWEVWMGLPDVKFEKATSRDGSETLKYSKDGDYIWVPNKTLEVLKKDPETILLALNSSKSNSHKMNVKWLSVQEGNLEEVFKKAIRMNVNGEKYFSYRIQRKPKGESVFTSDFLNGDEIISEFERIKKYPFHLLETRFGDSGRELRVYEEDGFTMVYVYPNEEIEFTGNKEKMKEGISKLEKSLETKLVIV